MTTPPVAIIAFNRPDYLGPVLNSLARQQDVERGPIALFQDGFANPHSGRNYGKPELIDQQVAMFRECFPHGEVFVAEHNLGPALQFERAEHWCFETCDAPVGIFFEDDLILSPHYLRTLLAMLEATADDRRVGYVAAYGTILPVPPAPPNSWVPMHLNWGFALRRAHWLGMKPFMNAYLDLVRAADYRDRDIVKIMALRDSWGQPGPYTTQDVLHTCALRKVDGIKLCAHARLARYIGARGLHISPSAYQQAGFAHWPVYTYPLDGFPPVDEHIYEWCCKVHDLFTGVGSMVA